tara:strand:+ start:2184 stop:2399 length:216 start_codon:yes stop_codon:yes gene_type:complete
MILSKLSSELSEYFIQEIKKEENVENLKENVINPLIDYTFHRLYPYILVTSVIFFLTFILAVIILYLIIKS